MEYEFAPGIKLDSINKTNVVEAFKQRIEGYYFTPIEILLNKKEFGFAATALLASLIDIFAKTENHDPTNVKNREKYIKWLEKSLGIKPKKAKFFYENFRCGLLHAGCVESSGQISYLQQKLFARDKEHIIINLKYLFQKLKLRFYIFISNEDPEELLKYLKGRISEINQ